MGHKDTDKDRKQSCEEAQLKVRKVRSYIQRREDGYEYVNSTISVPQCYIGKNVRVVIVDG
jgi:hypothetical protein